MHMQKNLTDVSYDQIYEVDGPISKSGGKAASNLFKSQAKSLRR